MRFAFNHLQVQGLLLSYLVCFTHAEHAQARMYHGAVLLDQDEADQAFRPADALILEDLDTCDAVTYADAFVQRGDELFQLLTTDGKTPCNITQAHELALGHLSAGFKTLEGRSIKSTADSPQPDVAPIVFSVTLFADTVTVGAGGIALGTIASVAVLAVAAGAVLYGIATLIATVIKAVNSRRDEGDVSEDLEVEEIKLSEFLGNKSTSPEMCCPPPPPPTPKRIKVSYAERNQLSEGYNHRSQTTDQNMLKSCISKIEAHTKAATQGCCNVQESSGGGSTAYSVGVQSQTPEHSTSFTCYQDKS